MKKKILLVDDEQDIIEFLEYNLEQQGFEVISANNGYEALIKLHDHPDLIILDVMMPEMNGFEVCKKIRSDKENDKIPIIFLTAKSSEVDEIQGLEFGANDYIQKPISPNLLISRIKANFRNVIGNNPEKETPAIIKIGPLVIDREKYIIFLNGEEKILPRKEFEVLYFLANNRDRVFSRDTLLREVWGADVYVVDRTVDVHIRKIREKLESHSDLIETIKGVGYKFKNIEQV